MKRVWSWAFNIVVIWLLIMVVVMFILPRFGDWRFDAVLSGSMEPALSVGGVVVIRPVEATNVHQGDIIAFQSGETLVTHRVVEVLQEQNTLSFVTKGDANEEADLSHVPASDVVGKVVCNMPYLGYFASFIKTRLGFLLAIILPGVAIIILELKNMWQTILKKDNYKCIA